LPRLAAAATSEAIDTALADLVDRGLMVRDADVFLSLAVPLGEYSPSEAILDRFYQLVDTLGSDLVVLSQQQATKDKTAALPV